MKLKDIIDKSDKRTKEVFTNNLPKIPNRENDGVTHINISKFGKTSLGIYIATTADPFTIPELGEFSNIKAFQIFILSNLPNDKMRYIKAYNAEKIISNNRSVYGVNDYRTIKFIKDAYYHIFMNNPAMKKQLIESTLPFDMYFSTKKNNDEDAISYRPDISKLYVWALECLRKEFKKYPNGNKYLHRPDYNPIIKKVKKSEEETVEKLLNSTTADKAVVDKKTLDKLEIEIK